MRDKNLTFSQFNIQLERNIRESNGFRKFLAIHVLDTPILLENLTIRLPKDFRRLRALAIVLWFFPDSLKWNILLKMSFTKFSWLNQKQQIEISVLLSSKENMLKYLFLTKRYTSFEIFGNFLGNDIRDLLISLKFIPKVSSVKRTSRRGGYQDHGSRRPPERWLPRDDFSLTEYQLQKEKKAYLQTKYIRKLLIYLERQTL